jgi:hypothetical protein
MARYHSRCGALSVAMWRAIEHDVARYSGVFADGTYRITLHLPYWLASRTMEHRLHEMPLNRWALQTEKVTHIPC